MAGDWTKVENVTPEKPEIAILARKLGVSLGDAFLSWFKLYRWAGGITSGGNVPFLSGSDADALSGCIPGTTDALASEEVGWIKAGSDCRAGITFSNWGRHNSKAAKARALDAARKRGDRGEPAPVFREMSGSQQENGRTREEREESERRVLSLNKGDRLAKGNGSSSATSNGKGTARHRSRRSPKVSRDEGRHDEPFDLSEVDWDRVSEWAERLGRKVPPRTMDDRRMWLRFAVLADHAFGESWLVDGTEAVLQAKETRSTRQAHLVGVLKAKAIEEHRIDDEVFVSMLGRIEIPKAIWKSNVLEIK